jgi:PEP-CTERM motif
MKFRMIFAAVLAMASSAAMAQALTITAAPGQPSFQAYLSNNLYVDGPEAINSGALFSSFPDPKNYLLFWVNTDSSVAPVFSATVDIAGTGYQFQNGLTSISTTPADAMHWRVATRWGGGPEPYGSCIQNLPCNVITDGSTISWDSSVASAAPYLDGTGEQFAIYSLALQQVTAVPEPQAYALAIAGLGVIGVMARRRKSAQA